MATRKENFLTVGRAFLASLPLPKEEADKQEAFLVQQADNPVFQTETDVELASRFRYYVRVTVQTAQRLMDEDDKWDAPTLKNVIETKTNEALADFQSLQTQSGTIVA